MALGDRLPSRRIGVAQTEFTGDREERFLLFKNLSWRPFVVSVLAQVWPQKKGNSVRIRETLQEKAQILNESLLLPVYVYG